MTVHTVHTVHKHKLKWANQLGTSDSILSEHCLDSHSGKSINLRQRYYNLRVYNLSSYTAGSIITTRTWTACFVISLTLYIYMYSTAAH